MDFTYVDNEKMAKIKVIGVGGAGGNALNNMIDANLQGVKFIAANTDMQDLDISKAKVKIQIGTTLTEGLGAGANPEVGREAAMESEAELKDALKDSHMIFIAAGLGGGTGTGAAPVVAKIAKELGALTVAVVSKPFGFEGKQRSRQAEAGLEELKAIVDTVIIIPNDKLRAHGSKNVKVIDMYKKADEILQQSVKGITDLIMLPGMINLDFADIRTIMSKSGGMALMGIGIASGENRSTKATEFAISHPLLEDISISGARGVLINITSTEDITMDELTDIMDRMHAEVGDEASIIWGHTFDNTLADEIHVTVIATGIEEERAVQANNRLAEQKYQHARKNIPNTTKGQLRDVTPEDLMNPSYHDSGLIMRKKMDEEIRDLSDIQDNSSINQNDLDTPTFIRRRAKLR